MLIFYGKWFLWIKVWEERAWRFKSFGTYDRMIKEEDTSIAMAKIGNLKDVLNSLFLRILLALGCINGHGCRFVATNVLKKNHHLEQNIIIKQDFEPLHPRVECYVFNKIF